MEHSFDVEIAKKYGIPCAILLKNIYFWTEKNRANGDNFYDGRYWTYNSKKAFSELFPYMTARQVDYALNKMVDEGLIITGNYNKVSYDRTLWYAITKKGYSILQNCKMEETKLLNGFNAIVQPIPDINTDNKPDNKPYINKGTDVLPNTNTSKKKKTQQDYSIFEEYAKDNEELLKALMDFASMRKSIKSPLTERAMKLLITELNKLSKDKNTQIAIINQSILNNWKGVFPLKENNARKEQNKYNYNYGTEGVDYL